MRVIAVVNLLSFQSAQGITADAIVGARTWQALFEFDVLRG